MYLDARVLLQQIGFAGNTIDVYITTYSKSLTEAAGCRFRQGRKLEYRRLKPLTIQKLSNFADLEKVRWQ